MVKWLLRKEAKVSITFEGPKMPKHAKALEAAIAVDGYNHLLSTLLRRYKQEGGDFSRLKTDGIACSCVDKELRGARSSVKSYVDYPTT